jgi:hypothetical protein
MGRISSSEGLDRLKKWANRNAELIVIYTELPAGMPAETPARIIVTESNELELSVGGSVLMKDSLDGAEFSDLPESASSKFVDTSLEVKFHDGKSLGFREPKQSVKGE